MQFAAHCIAHGQHIARRIKDRTDKAQKNQTAPMRYGHIAEADINAAKAE